MLSGMTMKIQMLMKVMKWCWCAQTVIFDLINLVGLTDIINQPKVEITESSATETSKDRRWSTRTRVSKVNQVWVDDINH